MALTPNEYKYMCIHVMCVRVFRNKILQNCYFCASRLMRTTHTHTHIDANKCERACQA